MLKFFFTILLLANGVLFAYQQGHLETLMPSGREPARVSNQLNADKIKLIPPPATGARAPAPAAPAVAVAAVAVQKPVEKPAPKSEVAACTEIGNFNREDARLFEAKLAALALGTRVSKRPIREVATHIVYIPPLPDLESAENKTAELRRLGITDYYIIQDNSSMRMGISLGVFRQEEAAREHLVRLSQKGVRSARIGARSVTTSMVAFQLRDLDAQMRDSVNRISATFPKHETRHCEPA
ncbi:SPOR domain-containing protein [Noviherbaspirillum cavernae]|uniref:SPOR domain-containing protein n=1 Tax=Noviherbaspirillum cavernae TaxID=2320862 RepID=A0A418WXB0_9BURK|nr:SPOR domain-containing protein [Noviherbaspirillum cavernae]RJG04879.1 SPOR domain-containing protein [Noviherbaspirillum cavernae]